MKSLAKLAAVGGVFAVGLVTAIAGPATAEESAEGSTSVEVTDCPGCSGRPDLAAWLQSDINFGEVEVLASPGQVGTDPANAIRVRDVRPDNRGWTLSMSTSDIVQTSGGDNIIPGDNVIASLGGGGFVETAGGEDNSSFFHSEGPGALGPAGALLASAPVGNSRGEYTSEIWFDLNIPGASSFTEGSPIGTYEGTYTVDIAPVD